MIPKNNNNENTSKITSSLDTTFLALWEHKAKIPTEINIDALANEASEKY